MRCSMTMWRGSLCAAFLSMATIFTCAQAKQMMTPESCTSLRYLSSDVTTLSPLQMSPDGTKVAYVLQVPDLQANINKETLFFGGVVATASSPTPEPLITDQLITAPHWFPDGQALAVLVRRVGKIVRD